MAGKGIRRRVCPCCDGAGYVRDEPHLRPDMKTIIGIVASVRHMPSVEFTGDRRDVRAYESRALVSIAASRAGFSSTRIGKALNRDHSSIIHAIRRAEEMMKEDAGFNREFYGVMTRLFGPHRGEKSGEARF